MAQPWLTSTCDPVAHSDQDEFLVRGRRRNDTEEGVALGCGLTTKSATAAHLGSAIRLASPDLAEPLAQIFDFIESADNSSAILERDRTRQLFLQKPTTPHGSKAKDKLDSECFKVAADCTATSLACSQCCSTCSTVPCSCQNVYPKDDLGADALLAGPCVPEPRPKTPRELFNERQKVTGTVCYHVHYSEETRLRPCDDILKLRIEDDEKENTKRVFVSALRIDGLAAYCGVQVGDEIVSVNGETPVQGFLSQPGGFASVEPPATILLMGFVGKFPAEVRLKRHDKCHGVVSSSQVFGASEVTLMDQVVFRPTEAPLLLASQPVNGGSTLMPWLYELRPAEAKILLNRVQDYVIQKKDEYQVFQGSVRLAHQAAADEYECALKSTYSSL